MYIYRLYIYGLYRVVACDVTGGVASLNFDATELKIFYGNLERKASKVFLPTNVLFV